MNKQETLTQHMVVEYHSIKDHIQEQKRLKINEINTEFFRTPAVSKPTIAEINAFMGKQKTTSDVVHVVDKSFLDWRKDNAKHTGIAVDINKVAGIYRLSWAASTGQFSVAGGGSMNNRKVLGDPAMLVFSNGHNIIHISFKAVDDTLKADIAWCLEFVSHITIRETARWEFI